MTNAKTTVLFIFQPREELQKYLENGLSAVPNLELIFPSDTEAETFLKFAPEADIIVGWRPTEELLNAAQKLSLFINPGVGVQHLTKLFSKLNQSRKITLCNGHGNTYFTAQHAVALLLALTNKIIPHHNWMAQGHWRKGDADAQSNPLRDRKIGLLGYGAINTKVHKFLAGFDLEFHVLKRDWKKKRVEVYPTPLTKYSPDKLHQFLSEIDILITAIPFTAQTEGLIGKTELKLLGTNGLLVTVARGEVLVEESLYLALKTKAIAGAAIDVWYNYRPEPDDQGRKFPFNYPFYELDNVILSPHRGASPMSDLRRWNEVIDNIS
ncbi:MAG: NAD(P)-dependent oxidoreductase, partial [Candidatus Heimdallarchaeota archaeon]